MVQENSDHGVEKSLAFPNDIGHCRYGNRRRFSHGHLNVLIYRRIALYAELSSLLFTPSRQSIPRFA
jgi:hypothetical protein